MCHKKLKQNVNKQTNKQTNKQKAIELDNKNCYKKVICVTFNFIISEFFKMDVLNDDSFF
jgi:hypothetical protein